MKNMTAMNAKQKQTGFTIIELVVVILLLGILTATALPRFMDVTDEAHDAVVDAVRGGFTTGVALYKAQWTAEGQPYESLVDSTGFNMYASTAGFPRSATLKNYEFVGVTSDDVCVTAYEALIQPSGRPTIAGIPDTLEADTDSDRETAIEDNAAGVDWVVALEADDETTPTVDTDTCTFYYVGQFKSGTADVNNSIPVVTYNFETGLVAEGTEFVLQED